MPALAGTTRLFLLSENAEGFARMQIHAVQAAEAVGIQHIVKLSVLGASDHSKAAIGREHWEVEQAIKATAVPYTILRSHSFMQNWLTGLAESVRREGRISEAIGDARVPFVDTRDIAEAAFRILVEPKGHTNRTYVLTGGEAVGYHDVAEVLSRILGKRVTYVPQSLEQVRARMRQQEMSPYLIDSTLALAAYQRAGGPTALVSDHLRELLGKWPRSIHEFLRDHAERFRKA